MACVAEFSRLTDVVIGQLEGNLVGLILHGSAVHGGLRPDSDIDLLAVVARPLTSAERASLTDALLRVSGRRALDGPARPAEITVVLSEDLSGDPAGIATEYQYGEWLRDEITSGRIPERHHNPDLVLILAMARTGVSVVGAAPEMILPEVSQADVSAALVAALPALLANVGGDERNVALTVARMQVTRDTGRFVPKDVAAELIAERVTDEYAQMLRTAAAAYRGEATDDWEALRPALVAYLDAAAAELTQ